jgi:hypothetical protein
MVIEFNSAKDRPPKTAQTDADRATPGYSTRPAARKIVTLGEDPAVHDALRASLIKEWAPANETEAALVDEICDNWLRLQRAHRVEAMMLEQFGAIEAFSNKTFLAHLRRMNAIERAWNRATSDLRKLRQGPPKQTTKG